MSVKFEITKNDKGEFHFKLLNADGKTLVRSEGYNAKASCANGIESVRKNAASDANFERKTAKDGSPFFNLKAGNGQVIGQSQMYSSEATRDAGIDSVMANAPGAAVDDQTA